ncbi:phosphonate C-P lyase system protein PhnH [Pseudooceanicola sediminis]|uniref:Phosphonate C-P lyase system protein PhnH n=1 Tax=Pseudooceanicola sediminis TaxID=2211117 RepID=A0A399IXZ3_9RHOB|nr:phosphonate C-P lyase system protein PhnH [Pseudooceanicola sediminis]KAA2312039.1 phosphonate C-P lyase system protein PhnH [Puniceibacterium sp. HSS470]RII38048.1 phosphonate C-P lyase system protein PhnH [Pseudooceanicola sediminis]|tara:strand:+ start:43315 stop:43896 length:582 start_codon:yes stop_codon:yes gene_type:complete
MEQTSDMLTGGFSDAPRQSARAFRAALEAMARPGSTYVLQEMADAPAPVSRAAATLLLVLCDAETPLHLSGVCDTPAIRGWVTFHTGAPLVAAAEAMFVLGDWSSLDLRVLARGTAEYPDRSATVIVDGDFEGVDVSLRGPGIKDVSVTRLPDVVVFQENAAHFPLGLDFYFTRGAKLSALPRSTRVTAGENA